MGTSTAVMRDLMGGVEGKALHIHSMLSSLLHNSLTVWRYPVPVTIRMW